MKGYIEYLSLSINYSILMQEPILFLKDASIFQQDSLVLSDINIEINKGEFIYLIGKTGSGKSSLMKTLYGDLSLQKGTGKIVDFKLLNDRNIEENLLFVLKATGWDNKESMKAKIQEVLGKVGMHTKGFKMPFEISGGEQQRIAIARALLNDPELILADEPTGNLDPRTSIEVMGVLEEIHKSGKTVLMATHDYALILKYPHRTIKCEGDELFEVVQQTN